MHNTGNLEAVRAKWKAIIVITSILFARRHVPERRPWMERFVTGDDTQSFSTTLKPIMSFAGFRKRRALSPTMPWIPSPLNAGNTSWHGKRFQRINGLVRPPDGSYFPSESSLFHLAFLQESVFCICRRLTIESVTDRLLLGRKGARRCKSCRAWDVTAIFLFRVLDFWKFFLIWKCK